jgi:hypothetical protein
MSVHLQMERARVAGEALAQVGLPALVFDDPGNVLVATHLIEALGDHIRWRAHDRVSLRDGNADALFRKAISTLDQSPQSNRSSRCSISRLRKYMCPPSGWWRNGRGNRRHSRCFEQHRPHATPRSAGKDGVPSSGLSGRASRRPDNATRESEQPLICRTNCIGALQKAGSRIFGRGGDGKSFLEMSLLVAKKKANIARTLDRLCPGSRPINSQDRDADDGRRPARRFA